jgi:hypothetical protein
MWHYPNKTIIVQISNDAEKSEIESWAINNDLVVLYGSGYDLVACGHLFSIVDLGVVDESTWSDYVESANESKFPAPCVVYNSDSYNSKEAHSNIRVVDPHGIESWVQLLDELLVLSLVCWNKNEEEWFEEILRNNAVNTLDEDGDSPLSFAIRTKCPLIVQKLIAAGADVNERFESGITLLMLSDSMHRPEAKEIRELLKRNGAGI